MYVFLKKNFFLNSRFVLCIAPSLTGVQVLVCGSVLLRLLEQQASGLLQTEPGDERYRGERLAGKPSADRSLNR